MAETRNSFGVSDQTGLSDPRLTITATTTDKPATIHRRSMSALPAVKCAIGGQYRLNHLFDPRDFQSISQIGKAYRWRRAYRFAIQEILLTWYVCVSVKIRRRLGGRKKRPLRHEEERSLGEAVRTDQPGGMAGRSEEHTSELQSPL